MIEPAQGHVKVEAPGLFLELLEDRHASGLLPMRAGQRMISPR